MPWRMSSSASSMVANGVMTSPQRERSLHVLADHVGLEVHGLARPRAAPSVVTASVCGISITSKRRDPSAATVRLTPSTATEPCGIRSGSKLAIRQRDPHPRRRFYTR